MSILIEEGHALLTINRLLFNQHRKALLAKKQLVNVLLAKYYFAAMPQEGLQ